jgi:hypothetical protein
MSGSESSSLVEASHYTNLRENRYSPRHPTQANGMPQVQVTLLSKGEATGPVLWKATGDHRTGPKLRHEVNQDTL